MSESIRINKRLSELNLASRREADTLITEGKVLVNGKKAVLGQKVSLEDKVTLQGEQKKRVYLAYYKGRGVISHSPEAHEVDIATKLKKDYGLTDVYPVGRLDKDSEGLIILTNDGRVTGPLLDPEAEVTKTYEVFLDKDLNGPFLKDMARGVDIEGYMTKPAEAERSAKGSKKRFTLTITEGKKHQIRRMCAALGFQVQSLKRIQILNIEIGELKPNQYRKIAGPELQEFLKKLQIQK